MRPDRPLIVAVLLLASGSGLIFGYCHGTAGVNAAYPLSGCAVNLCTTTTGPGALGGLMLLLLGVFVLLWTFVLAVLAQFGMLVPRRRAAVETQPVHRAERPPE